MDNINREIYALNLDMNDNNESYSRSERYIYVFVDYIFVDSVSTMLNCKDNNPKFKQQMLFGQLYVHVVKIIRSLTNSARMR